MPVSPETLLAFAAASLVLLVMPGPTIVMVVSQALAHGRSVAFASVMGVALGDLCAATLSVIGVGTVLATSATLFTAIKWLGAAYLVWIGVKLWRSPITRMEVDGASTPRTTHWVLFRDAYLVTLFNPKAIVFFLAFLPQFIDRSAPFAPQAAVLVGTFVVLGALNALAYAWLAGGARSILGSATVLRRLTRAGSLFLMTSGLASLLVKRA